MQPLTHRQKKVLNFILGYAKANLTDLNVKCEENITDKEILEIDSILNPDEPNT